MTRRRRGDSNSRVCDMKLRMGLNRGMEKKGAQIDKSSEVSSKRGTTGRAILLAHWACPLELKYESSRPRALGLFTQEALGWNEVNVRLIVIYNHAMPLEQKVRGGNPGRVFFKNSRVQHHPMGAPEHRLQSPALSDPKR